MQTRCHSGRVLEQEPPQAQGSLSQMSAEATLINGVYLQYYFLSDCGSSSPRNGEQVQYVR